MDHRRTGRSSRCNMVSHRRRDHVPDWQWNSRAIRCISVPLPTLAAGPDPPPLQQEVPEAVGREYLVQVATFVLRILPTHGRHRPER